MRQAYVALSASAFLLSTAAGGPAFAVEAPARRAFAIEDFYRLKPVGEPAISPDGRTIVYVVTETDLRKATRSLNLWRMDANGRNARPLTRSDGKRNEHPAFSPDGRTLAFVSNRDGDPQLFLLPLDGGDPVRKTDWPGGIGDPLFSPDGTKVAFTADVSPACAGDAACNKKLDDARDANKVKAHLTDRLLYRHWTDWKDGKRSHVLLLDLSKTGDGAIRDLTPGDFDSPVFSLGGPSGFAFSPDGKELVFTSNREKDEASSTNANLYTVALDAPSGDLARPRDLTPDNPGWDGTPAFSPDGRWLAYRTQRVPGFEADRFRIALIDRSPGTAKPVPKFVTEAFDYNVGEIVWSADSRTIYFTAEVRGRTPLHALDVATGKIRVLSETGTIDGFAVSKDGAFAVLARRRIHQPWELHRVDLTGRTPSDGVRLTTHNAAVESEVDIRPAEEVFVPGADGKPVQMWIVKPHGFDPAKKYPVILNVHGGPQSQWADSLRGDWQVYPGLGYVVAFPNPHGSTGFGQDYTAAISGDWTGKVMTDIEKVTDWLTAQSWADRDRIGLMGWSWGGYAVMWLQGHSTRYKAMASMMGVYDLRSMYSATEEIWFPQWDLKGAPWENQKLYAEQTPSAFVKGFRTPTLVITGQRDFRVPYTQSLMFFTDLQKRGVPSRLLVFEKAGHWPAWYEMAVYYAAHADWFHRHLGGEASPWDPAKMVDGTIWDDAAKK